MLVCVALGALSAAVLPTVPSYDPWSWIVWGREVSDPHLSFVVSGGPSWKPLPFLFTTIWGLFGSAAPTLWIVTARIGGLLGLVAAWRVANKLLQGGWGGAVAGLLAVGGVLLTQDWVYYFLHGTSEVGLIGCSLWAVDRLLEGRKTQAFWLMIAAGWIRPEWWPFVIAYALWLGCFDEEFRNAPMRAMLLIGLASMPIAWFVPPWVGSGHPFLAASHAKDYNGHLGPHKFIAVNSRGVNDQVIPMIVFGIAAVVIGFLKDRRRVMLALGLAVIAWWVVVVAETMKGYPGLERFFLPSAGLICVLGGVGIVRLAQLAGSVAGDRALPATIVAILVLVGASVPLITTRITEARQALPLARVAVDTSNSLSRAVAAVGGHRGVLPCRSSFAAVNHGVQTELAWKLHVTLERVGTVMSRPGVDFIGPHNSTDGEPVDPRLTHSQTLADVDGWHVVRLTTPGLPQACDGH